jgi:hypothetical protein
MEITVPWTPVKALLHLSGKEDIREWVNGVWIDQKGPRVIVWATTGTALGALQLEEPSTDTPDVFLPRHIVEACKGFAVQATVKREDDGRMSISCMGTTHYWQDKGLTSIDWRRAVPSGQSDGRSRQVDVQFLPAFVKVREVLKGRKSLNEAPLLLAHRSAPKEGPDGLLVQLTDIPEFVGVVMPLNDAALAVVSMRKAAPDWVRELGRVEALADLI